jgi:hypothetical protein
MGDQDDGEPMLFCEVRQALQSRADIAAAVAIDAATCCRADVRTGRIDHDQLHVRQLVFLLKPIKIDAEIEKAFAIAIFDRLYEMNPAPIGTRGHEARHYGIGRVILRG